MHRIFQWLPMHILSRSVYKYNVFSPLKVINTFCKNESNKLILFSSSMPFAYPSFRYAGLIWILVRNLVYFINIMKFSQMDKCTFNLMISSVLCSCSRNNYHIISTLEIFFMQPVTFSDKPC